MVYTLKGHSGPVTSIAFSPDSRRIATSVGEGATLSRTTQGGETKLWDAATGQALLLLADGY